VSSNQHIDIDLLRNYNPYGSIYVCTDALQNFAQNFLPQIATPFTLVSGDSDMLVNDITVPHIATILNSQYLIVWYAQNLSVNHPKLFHMPIGLDYHSMWEKPGTWGLSATYPSAQENSLVNTFSKSPIFEHRYLAAYCNWHFAIERGDRQECASKVARSICFYEPTAVPRQSTWIRQAECMFVLSPEGAGMDCHRTWEALFLGSIPIIKKNPILLLFDDLPVLIVDDWGEVTRATLEQYISELPNKKFDFSTLFTTYWSKRINCGVDESVLNNLTYAEFRKILTRQTG
jgi:hypothetical protein